MDWSAVAVAAATGAASGSLAALGVPWVQHEVDKRRRRTDRRIELIGEWRAMLARHHKEQTSDIRIEHSTIASDESYLSLRAHLPEELVKRVEASLSAGINISTGSSTFLGIERDVMAAIDGLERQWGLA